MSNSEEEAFLTLRQSNFGNSFGPSTTTNVCVSHPTSHFAHQDIMFAGTCGCPQGSSLGPVLWNLYQNDLFCENIRSQLSAYAEDHQRYISGEKIDNVVSSLEEGGNTTGRWYKSNYLSGNPSKYQVLVLSRAKQEVKKAVHIDSHTVGQAQEIKLLG